MRRTIKFDTTGESQVFLTLTGERAFFRRNRDGLIHLAREADGLPIGGDFGNVYREFADDATANEYAVAQLITI